MTILFSNIFFSTGRFRRIGFYRCVILVGYFQRYFIDKCVSITSLADRDGTFYQSREVFLFDTDAHHCIIMHRDDCNVSDRINAHFVSSTYLWNV